MRRLERLDKDEYMEEERSEAEEIHEQRRLKEQEETANLANEEAPQPESDQTKEDGLSVGGGDAAAGDSLKSENEN